MKSKKLVIALSVTAAILFVILLILGGLTWYQATHVFVGEDAYPLKSESLDLREKDVSFAYYDTLQAQLPQCRILWSVPFQGSKVSSDADHLVLQSLTLEDIDTILRYFPNVKTVDAEQCTDYEMLEALLQKAPGLQLSYKISLGGISVSPESQELELKPQDYTLEALMENLPHLTGLTAITLKTPELTIQQVDELREAFPEITFTCTVDILGTEYDTETKALDLSTLSSDEVKAVAEKLPALTGLETVELNDKDGKSRISMEEAKLLMDAAPQAKFNYTFDFYGVDVNTLQEEVKLHNKKIGDKGEQTVRLALDLMQNCKRFVLENCRISNDVMAKIRDDYRDKTKVVWRIYFGEGTSLTDAEVLRSTYNVQDDNCHDLVYLEDVKYMDIGHNEFLDDIPFVAGMKSLEVVIISGAPVHDLTPFENCPNLRILEMANCLYAPDLTPLKKCSKLEMVNISFTKVADLSPLDDLKLTHLCAVHNKISNEEQERFVELHPDCLSKFRGDNPYSTGWRYNEKGDKLPWYEDISNVFRYPNSPNNVGWYLDK